MIYMAHNTVNGKYYIGQTKQSLRVVLARHFQTVGLTLFHWLFMFGKKRPHLSQWNRENLRGKPWSETRRAAQETKSHGA